MRLNVEIPAELYEELTAGAKSEGRNVSDVIRALVAEWCRKKARDYERKREKEQADGRVRRES